MEAAAILDFERRRISSYNNEKSGNFVLQNNSTWYFKQFRDMTLTEIHDDGRRYVDFQQK